MSAFNGAGTFVISGVGLPFVTGTTISSTVANQLNTDLATGLSTCLTKDGQTTPTNNIPMGGFKITGLGPPTAPGDALVYGQPATVSDLTVTGNGTVAGTLTVTGKVTAPGIANPNLIINGDIKIDQRNGGALINFTNIQAYICDRWIAISTGLTTQTVSGQATGSTIAGCVKALKFTSGGAGLAPAVAAFAIQAYKIEGLDCYGLFWGLAQAKPLTVSFRAKSNQTGNFGLSARNNASDRFYQTSFALVAGVDTDVSITFPGDTGGTWDVGTLVGINLTFDLGVGANFSSPASVGWAAGNLFGLTGGVKLPTASGSTLEIGNIKAEIGNIATPFVGDNTEVSFAKCQRYYWNNPIAVAHGCWLDGGSAEYYSAFVKFPVKMRASASASFISIGQWSYSNSANAGVNFTPIPGTTSTVNDGIEGQIRIDNGTPAQGGPNIYKTGNWVIQCAFNAEI